MPKQQQVTNDPLSGIPESQLPLDPSDKCTDSSGIFTRSLLIANANATVPELAKNAGKFYIDDGNNVFRFFDTVTVVILDARKHRKRRNEERKVVCRSWNCSESTDGNVCKGCEWLKKDLPNNVRCKSSWYNLAVWFSPEDNPIDGEPDSAPFFLQFTSGAFMEWVEIQTGIESRGWPIFGLALTFGTELKQHASKTSSYIPKLVTAVPLDNDTIAGMRIIRQEESYRYGDTPVAEAPSGTDDPFADE